MAVSARLEGALGRLSQTIMVADENNKRKQEVGNAVAELNTGLKQAENLDKLMTYLIKNLTIYSANFRNTRKSELEDETRRVLKFVFPNEGFDIKIDWSEGRGRPQAQILTGLKGPNGVVEWCPPRNVHGEFAKQLIAFTTICNIAIMLGSQTFCSDEALNSGDDESLVSTKPLMDKLGELLQFIVIEHKDNFYKNIDRREILLEKIPGDGGSYSGYVQIVSNQEILPKEE